ncbi:hypothetical protein HNY73_016768 [Argiope bruennichi]|uniref:Uncharacterized protein n=1 Tax=Argiope bruennichi TaxID=94029 RepID=A0A8T0EPT9_ARGBR|nr:hypothetical protein HNY73_016768 [Argiope bruennichi]
MRRQFRQEHFVERFDDLREALEGTVSQPYPISWQRLPACKGWGYVLPDPLEGPFFWLIKLVVGLKGSIFYWQWLVKRKQCMLFQVWGKRAKEFILGLSKR